MRYRIYLQLEKSLQPNTVEAYIGDVNKLLSFFGNADRLLAVTLDDLREFLSAMADVGVNARSQARIISSLRSFYGFLTHQHQPVSGCFTQRCQTSYPKPPT